MQNQPEAAYHYTAVYELIDPGNADMFYFKALLFARQGKNQETMEALKLSADNGFEDIEKLRAEPSFKNIRDAELFEEAVNKIMENISQ